LRLSDIHLFFSAAISFSILFLSLMACIQHGQIMANW